MGVTVRLDLHTVSLQREGCPASGTLHSSLLINRNVCLLLSLTLLLLSLLFPGEHRHCQAHSDVRGENRTGSQNCPHGNALPSPLWPYCSFQRCPKELTILTASFLPHLWGGITSPVGDLGTQGFCAGFEDRFRTGRGAGALRFCICTQ